MNIKVHVRSVSVKTNNKRIKEKRLTAPQVLAEVRRQPREDYNGGTVQVWSSISHLPPKVYKNKKTERKETSARNDKKN